VHQQSLRRQNRFQQKKPRRIQHQIKNSFELFQESRIGNDRVSHLRLLQRQLPSENLRNKTKNSLRIVRIQEHHGGHVFDDAHDRFFYRNISDTRNIVDHIPLLRSEETKTNPTVLVLENHYHSVDAGRISIATIIFRVFEQNYRITDFLSSPGRTATSTCAKLFPSNDHPQPHSTTILKINKKFCCENRFLTESVFGIQKLGNFYQQIPGIHVNTQRFFVQVFDRNFLD
jgi:hypothetical protein